MFYSYSKFDRAQDRIQELEAALIRFGAEHPCATWKEIDTKRGVVTYFAEDVPEVPEPIPAILGDALQNLRSALDHLAYKLVEKFSAVDLFKKDGSPNTRIGFPICDTAQEFEDAIPKQVPGLGQYAAFEMVRRTAAYERGNRYLWMLGRLNNIDKHRLLLAACVKQVARSLSPSEKDCMVEKHGVIALSHFHYTQQNLVGSTGPLKTGDILYTCPISEAKDDMRFVFDVAINETGTAEGQPFIILVKLISMEVRMVLDQLRTLL